MLQQLRNVNFGRNRADQTGSSGIGYAVLDQTGSIVSSRTTSGVYQLTPGSGLYAAYVSFPDGFRGQILWDCPSLTGSLGNILSQSFATEQYNVEENDPKAADTWQMVNDMTGTVQSIYDINYGRWKVDKTAKQMIFYADDNVTEVARFGLFDANGVAAFDGVFERRKV